MLLSNSGLSLEDTQFVSRIKVCQLMNDQVVKMEGDVNTEQRDGG